MGEFTFVVAKHPVALLLQPRMPSLLLQRTLLILPAAVQVRHVERSVVELFRCQRSLQPIGAGLALGKIYAETRLDQILVTQRIALVQQRAGYLRIEHRRRQYPEEGKEHQQVFRAGVQYFDDSFVEHQRPERSPVTDAKRIHQRNGSGIGNLQQTQLGVERADPHELGIERQRRALLPVRAGCGQSCVGGDYRVIEHGQVGGGCMTGCQSGSKAVHRGCHCPP